ncbi:MAG: hypothetical protein IMW89_19590 [Ktedonobacteraceae bacterium]|nr:hypothetical protein [Ktedonobacteraceae bacterium]
MFVRIVQAIIGIAGLGALTLGLLYWIFQIDLVNWHMLFGLTVALGLLILAVVALLTGGLRGLGAVSLIYALIVPVFGLTQATLLPGDWHWLIRVAHLLVGLGALALMGTITRRYLSLKAAENRQESSQVS